MTESAKEARREYLRQWRKNHPEKVKQHQETFWERKAKEQASEPELCESNS